MPVYFDVETTGPCQEYALDPRKGSLLTIQFSYDGRRAELVDCREGVPPRVRRLLGDPKVVKVAHNAKFDLAFLKQRAGVEVRNVVCTLLAEGVLMAGRREPADLASLAWKYGKETLDKERRFWGDLRQGQLLVDFEKYALRDIEVLPAVWMAQRKMLEDDGLLGIAKLEFDLLPAVLDMELRGIKLDEERWAQAMAEVEAKREEKERELYSHYPAPAYQLDIFGGQSGTVNWDSPLQVRAILNELDIPLESTAKDILKDYLRKNTDAEIIKVLLEYREQASLARFDLPEYINPQTGRIHAEFKQLGTRAGRFSCQDPNLQQVPRDNRFRRCFVAEEGYKIVSADYGQIELRCLAEIADEENMLAAFREGRDLHQETAEAIFDWDAWQRLEGEGRKPRDVAKNINFAISFGAGAERIASMAGTSYLGGGRILNSYYQAYPAILAWKNTNIKESMARRYSLTVAGRRRYLPETAKNDRELIAFQHRVAVNTPIQGTAADIAKRALVRLHKALAGSGAGLVSFIHDENVIEAPADIVKDVAAVVRREMVKAGREYLHEVPIEVDVSVSDCWSK